MLIISKPEIMAPGWGSLVGPCQGHPVAGDRSETKKKPKIVKMAFLESAQQKGSEDHQFPRLSMKICFQFVLPRNGQRLGP